MTIETDGHGLDSDISDMVKQESFVQEKQSEACFSKQAFLDTVFGYNDTVYKMGHISDLSGSCQKFENAFTFIEMYTAAGLHIITKHNTIPG